MMATWAGERRDFFRDRGGMRKIVWMLGALQFLCLFHCFVFRSYSKDAGWSVSNIIIRQRMKNGNVANFAATP
jgi:hypothetical protein